MPTSSKIQLPTIIMDLSRKFLMVLALGLSMEMISHAALAADNSQKTMDEKTTKSDHMARITGIGGVFFKSQKDPKALAAWYQKNLGMPLEPYGIAILRGSGDQSAKGLGTAWKVTEKDSAFYEPSQSNFMINYRIDNMDEMVAQLKHNQVTIVKGPESHENGKFLEVLDLEGNKVQLWEPKVWDEKNKKP
jgi:predicted enzyme related to lactoylglutathione lyase